MIGKGDLQWDYHLNVTSGDAGLTGGRPNVLLWSAWGCRETGRMGVRTLGLYSQPWQVPPASAETVSASLSRHTGKVKHIL